MKVNAKELLRIVGVLGCFVSVVTLMTRQDLRDSVSFNAFMELGESALHHIAVTERLIHASVTEKEEMIIGDRTYEELIKSGRIDLTKDIELENYVSDVGAMVSKAVRRPRIKYKFHIFSSKFPNAFSLPGGHILVSKGMLDVLSNEAELASVLAHEITHVDAKHCISRARSSQKGGGSAALGDNNLVIAGYSEVEEYEADMGSVFLLRKAGYYPQALIDAFVAIDKECVKTGYESSSLTPVGDILSAFGGAMVRYFDTHPGALDRIDKIKRYVAENGAAKDSVPLYIGKKNYAEKVPVFMKPYDDERFSGYPVEGSR